MMKTLSTPSTNPAAECPLSHPFTAHPKQCATCTGAHSPAADHIAAQHWLSGLLRFTLFRAMYDCAWGTIHWNGHFFASNSKPWKQTAVEGTMPMHFRISYFTMATVISVLATFAFGAAIARSKTDWVFWQGGLAMLIVAGPGWLLQALFALSARGNSSLDYLSHMATVMWKGTMPLAVTSLIVLVAGPMSATLFAATVLISSMMMARAHFLRVHSLGISQAWTLTWLLSLQITAWGAVAFLPFVQPLIYWS